MRKVILFNMVTLDGFFEGPNREIDWHHVDAEFNEFAIAQLDSADGLLFGRITYQLMANYWPTPTAMENDPIVADKMNNLPKIVLSRTLEKAEWNNTRLIKENIADEISKLKQQPGKDLLLFGSADLASTLTQLGLIDEYRIMVNPVVLGSGNPLFKRIHHRLDLKLVNARTFRSGNVLLYYQPNRK
jgi:dihydrofolate reductase